MKKVIMSLFVCTSLLGTIVSAETSSDVQTNIDSINADLQEKSEKTSDLLAKISDNKKQLGDEQRKQAKLKEKVENQARITQTGVSNETVLDILLSNDNWQDKLNQLQSMSTLVNNNQQLLQDLNNSVKEVEITERQLNADLKKLKDEQSDLKKQNDELTAKHEKLRAEEEKAKTEAEAEKKRKEAEALAAQQQANSSVIDGIDTVDNSSTNTSNNAGGSGDANGIKHKQYSASQAREAFEQITKDLGISASEKAIWISIIEKESGWNTTIWNGAGSGAYGLGQALPASKMAAYGSDYMTNPYTQLTWMYHYVIERYGSFAGIQWESRGWY